MLTRQLTPVFSTLIIEPIIKKIKIKNLLNKLSTCIFLQEAFDLIYKWHFEIQQIHYLVLRGIQKSTSWYERRWVTRPIFKVTIFFFALGQRRSCIILKVDPWLALLANEMENPFLLLHHSSRLQLLSILF